MQVEQAAFERFAQIERAVDEREHRRAERGYGDDAPDAPAVKQHRAQRHLHQIERDERVGRAAAKIQLRGQRQHVEQQRQEEFGMGDVGAPPQDHHAAKVHGRRDAGDHQHGREGQADVHGIMDDQDGRDLACDRDPAQLHQQRHILAPGRIGGPLAGEPARAQGRVALHARRSFPDWRMTKI